MFRFCIILLLLSSQIFGTVEESILPLMDAAYSQKNRLRVMTYNMLYNVPEAEKKLPPKHRWEQRRPRLLEYLLFAKADLIGSQELQEDQLHEIMNVLGSTYDYYGEKTRENEGRRDVNAIFFNKERLELLESATIPYSDDHYQNGFTLCTFKDKIHNKIFVVANTKLTWSDKARRLAEATELNHFSSSLSKEIPILILGDFNTFPFILKKFSISFDGPKVQRALTGKNLKDAKEKSTFGHYGPNCSITNSIFTQEPFVGPQLYGFVLDHILISEQIEVFTHGIDIAKVNGEFPSDHFPVIADLGFAPSALSNFNFRVPARSFATSRAVRPRQRY